MGHYAARKQATLRFIFQSDQDYSGQMLPGSVAVAVVASPGTLEGSSGCAHLGGARTRGPVAHILASLLGPGVEPFCLGLDSALDQMPGASRLTPWASSSLLLGYIQ